MRALGLAIVISAVVGGCTTDQAKKTMQSEWIGRHSDEFFLTNGPPISDFMLQDGRRIYTWQSGVQNFNMPATSSTTFSGSGPYMTATTQTSGGGTITVSCKALITVQPNGLIVDIKPSEDSIGIWTLSRCAELFPAPSQNG